MSYTHKKNHVPFKHLFLLCVFNTKSDYSTSLFTLIVWQMSYCKGKSPSCTFRVPWHSYVAKKPLQGAYKSTLPVAQFVSLS